MNRLLVGAAVGVLVGILAGAALGIHADDAEASPEVVARAAEVGVDPLALQGAVNTTGYDASTYLCLVGEGPCPPPPIVGAVARARCIMDAESGGLDVPNRQHSGAWGPGQYFPNTWSRHTSIYRAESGYAGPLSLHSYVDVERVIAWMLAFHPASRTEWSVGGC